MVEVSLISSLFWPVATMTLTILITKQHDIGSCSVIAEFHHHHVPVHWRNLRRGPCISSYKQRYDISRERSLGIVRGRASKCANSCEIWDFKQANYNPSNKLEHTVQPSTKSHRTHDSKSHHFYYFSQTLNIGLGADISRLEYIKKPLNN